MKLLSSIAVAFLLTFGLSGCTSSPTLVQEPSDQCSHLDAYEWSELQCESQYPSDSPEFNQCYHEHLRDYGLTWNQCKN